MIQCFVTGEFLLKAYIYIVTKVQVLISKSLDE